MDKVKISFQAKIRITNSFKILNENFLKLNGILSSTNLKKLTKFGIIKIVQNFKC